MAAIWASELLKLVPCIQLRDEKKIKTLRTCSSQPTYCAMSPKLSWFAIDSFIWFPKFSKATKLQKPSLSCFCFGVSRASLASLSLAVSVLFLAGRQGWQQWLFITYFQWFGLPNGEASGASRNSPWRTSNFPLRKPLQLKYQGHEFSFFAMCQWSTANFNA